MGSAPAGNCVECNANNQCDDGNECTVDTCGANNRCNYSATGAEGNDCDAGPGAGACYGGARLQAALDDSLDPVDDINVDFNRGGIVTVINRVSYPLGDAEDVVSDWINKQFLLWTPHHQGELRRPWAQ